ncbi:MAG: hypothetical protein M3066_03190 [Actinomycetota bacterium]|nr:hypothetical protein [Actinomycetota bacterium]
MEDLDRFYADHYWRATVRRGERPTAIIEKPKPKNRRSVRTIALSAPAALLVADLRAQHVARAAACGVTLPLDSFVFAAEVDGSRPIRPETWTRRFTRLRAEVGLPTVRLHDLRHLWPPHCWRRAPTSQPWPADWDTAAAGRPRAPSTATSCAAPHRTVAAADLLADLVRPPPPSNGGP